MSAVVRHGRQASIRAGGPWPGAPRVRRPVACKVALLIALQREDVVLPGDLALRKSVQAAYQLDHLPSQQEVLAIAEKWRPYRSLATSYLFSAAFEPAEAPPAAQLGSA